MATKQINQYTVTATAIAEGSFFDMDANIGTVPSPIFESQKVPESVMKEGILKPREMNYADAATLVSTSSLKVGNIYSLTDVGISIMAVKPNKFSICGVREMRIVKNLYYTPAAGVLGVWKATLTPAATNVAIWGGKVWTNNAGAVGTATSDESLSAAWTVVANTDNTYYEDKFFCVKYIFSTGVVVEQRDDRGNVVFSNINITDWGNINIKRNYSTDGIFNNANGFEIADNSNFGAIKANTNNGLISRNSNVGIISDNSCDDSIYNNSNIGSIQNMSNAGAVYNNSNNGYIQNIGVLNDNVSFNINNGFIGTTTTGTISDTTVNK